MGCDGQKVTVRRCHLEAVKAAMKICEPICRFRSGQKNLASRSYMSLQHLAQSIGVHACCFQLAIVSDAVAQGLPAVHAKIIYPPSVQKQIYG